MWSTAYGSQRSRFKVRRVPNWVEVFRCGIDDPPMDNDPSGSIASLIDATLSSDSEAQSDHSSEEEGDPTRQRVRTSFVFVVRAGMNMRARAFFKRILC